MSDIFKYPLPKMNALFRFASGSMYAALMARVSGSRKKMGSIFISKAFEERSVFRCDMSTSRCNLVLPVNSRWAGK